MFAAYTPRGDNQRTYMYKISYIPMAIHSLGESIGQGPTEPPELGALDRLKPQFEL